MVRMSEKEPINARRWATDPTMPGIYETLAIRALSLRTSPDRVVIAVAGPPGSGKTTLAAKVAEKLNEYQNDPTFAAVVPMDGFHYTRAQLDQFPDPKEAHFRRGAPFTFDADAVVDVIQTLKTATGDVKVPTFDHKAKDPVTDGLTIKPETRIVLVEGLYLLLKDEPWSNVHSAVDDKWLIQVDEAVARERVAKRHFASGITDSYGEGLKRYDGNDLANGRLVVASSVQPDFIIPSLDHNYKGVH